MKALRNKRHITAAGLSVIFLLLCSGCFNVVVEKREPLPGIIWPKPPDIPRIRFANSISSPEDAGIADGALKRFFRFFIGKGETYIIKPYGIETDAEGRIYVVDAFLRKILVYDITEHKYYAFPEKETEFVSPIDVAIDDRRGRIYVSDSAKNVVKVFTKKGGYLEEIKSGSMGRPTGIAVNKITDELLVVDTINSGILRFALKDHRLKGVIGMEGEETGRFHSPAHISVSQDGNIFVTDSLNFRVQVLTPEGGFIKSFGSAGGGPGYFSRPKGVAVDSDGNIYVVDALFDNVQIFNEAGHLLMSFGGPGHKYGEFWLPSGIFIDSKDMIYISDTFNKRVQVFQYLK